MGFEKIKVNPNYVAATNFASPPLKIKVGGPIEYFETYMSAIRNFPKGEWGQNREK